MFSGRLSVPLSVRPSVRDSRGFMFPQYLQYLLTDFRQTFVTGASWDTDDLITFLGQKVKVTIAAEVHSTRTLPSSGEIMTLGKPGKLREFFLLLFGHPEGRVFRVKVIYLSELLLRRRRPCQSLGIKVSSSFSFSSICLLAYT